MLGRFLNPLSIALLAHLMSAAPASAIAVYPGTYRCESGGTEGGVISLERDSTYIVQGQGEGKFSSDGSKIEWLDGVLEGTQAARYGSGRVMSGQVGAVITFGEDSDPEKIVCQGQFTVTR